MILRNAITLAILTLALFFALPAAAEPPLTFPGGPQVASKGADPIRLPVEFTAGLRPTPPLELNVSSVLKNGLYDAHQRPDDFTLTLEKPQNATASRWLLHIKRPPDMSPGLYTVEFWVHVGPDAKSGDVKPDNTKPNNTLGARKALITIGLDVKTPNLPIPAWLWIFGCVLFGVGLGYLVRVRLKRWQEREQAMLALGTLRVTLEKVLQEIPDPTFTRTLQPHTQTLDGAADFDIAQIITATQNATEALANAKRDLSRRLAAQKARIAAVKHLLSNTHNLPETIATRLKSLNVEGAQSAQEDLNADAASETLDRLEHDALVALQEAGRAWHRETSRSLRSWVGVKDQLPRAIRDACMVPAQKALATLDDLDLSTEEPHALRDSLLQANHRVRAAVDDALIWWSVEGDAVVRLLDAKGIAAAQRQHLANSIRPPESTSLSLDQALEELPALPKSFRDAFCEALAGRMGPDDVRDALETEDHDYRRVAEQLSPPMVAKSLPGLDDGLEASHAEPTSLDLVVRRLRLTHARRAEPAASRDAKGGERLLLPDPVTFVGQVRRRMLWFEGLQVAWAIFALTAVAYAGYGDTFSGSFPEQAAIFAVAFTADLSLDGIIATIKKLA